MKRALILFMGLTSLFFDRVSSAKVIHSSTNPYQLIVRSNIFRLTFPKPTGPSEEPKAPVPKIVINGFTTILPDKRVLMTVDAANSSGRSEERHYILSEGQTDDGIEVLEINVKHETVTVRNSGNVMVLKLETARRVPEVPLLPK